MKMKKFLLWVFFFVSVNGIYGQGPAWEWAKSAGGGDFEDGGANITDAHGNIYATGIFRSPTLILGNDTLVNSGLYDMFIVKYDNKGNVLWAKSAGGSGIDGGGNLAIDSNGYIYMAGGFGSSSITFGNIILTNAGNENDIYLVKYNPNGNVVWAKRAGGSRGENSNYIALDKHGNIFITGYYRSTDFTFGGTTLINKGNTDIYFAKYDSAGNELWIKSAGGTYDESAYNITIDTFNNIFITGVFYSSPLTIGSTTLTNMRDWDIFIAKYNADGDALWARSGNGINRDEAHAIVTDKIGNVYVAGYFFSPSITFDSKTLKNVDTTGTSPDLFIAKYDYGGILLWIKSIGGDWYDMCNGITIDAEENIYITGFFASSTVNFGDTTLTTYISSNIFIAKYDKNGNPFWAMGTAGNTGAKAWGISIDKNQSLNVAGNYSGPSISFGSTTLSNAGSFDFFIAKLSITTNVSEFFLKDIFLLIYPNPARNKLTIAFNSINHYLINHLTLTDLTGRLIIKKFFPAAVGENRIDIDVIGVASGVYIVTVNDGEREMRGKVVVE